MREREQKIYLFLREKFLIEHPVCEICRRRASLDIHHRKGRYGKLLTDVLWWMAACRFCHQHIHDHPAEARKKGWLVRSP